MAVRLRLFGGLCVAVPFLDMSAAIYMTQTQEAIGAAQFAIGGLKSFVFGALVALLGCYFGLRAERSAAGVGAATTTAVVSSIVGDHRGGCGFCGVHECAGDLSNERVFDEPEDQHRGGCCRLRAAAVQSGISVDIQDGEIFAIVGDSGSGKSTLLKTMVGLLPPQSGRILFDGKTLEEHMQHGPPPFGILFQSGALWTSMSVLENVTVPMDLQGYSIPAARPALARFKLALVGLAGDEDRYPASLSGGMRKRAALARALALDPSVLFLDEPSAGLDPLTSRRLDELVLTLRDGLGITVVLVTHELESLYSIADRMLFLDGEAHRPVALGSPAELARSADSRKVRDFLARRGLRLPRTWRPQDEQTRRDAHRRICPGRDRVDRRWRPVFRQRHVPEKRIPIVSFFPGSVAGLRVGAAVTFRGVRVGEVKSIGIRVNPDTGSTSLRSTWNCCPGRLRSTAAARRATDENAGSRRSCSAASPRSW